MGSSPPPWVRSSVPGGGVRLVAGSRRSGRAHHADDLGAHQIDDLVDDVLGQAAGVHQHEEPIEAKLFGDDTAVLETLSAQVEETLGGVSGVVDVVGMRRGNPELTWVVDAAAAGRLGLTAADVATARQNVRPSLDPVQVESLRAFAGEH